MNKLMEKFKRLVNNKKKILLIFSIVLILVYCYVQFGFSPRTPHFQKSKITFVSPLHLTSGQLGFLKPQFLQDKDNILYAMWVDEATTFLAKSSDDGKNWDSHIVSSGKQAVYEDWPYCFKKDLQGNLYLVQTSQEESGIFFSSSKDNGETWIEPVYVNDDRRKFAYCRNPSFAIDDKGNLFIIYTKRKTMEEIDPWKGEDESTQGLYLSRSFDEGHTWSKSIFLKDIPYTGPIDFSSLINYKDVLYLAYGDAIYKSINKGESWKRILGLKSQFGNITPIIKNDSEGNLYVMWQRAVITKDETGRLGGGKLKGYVDICFSKSTNGGQSWTHLVKINDAELSFEWKSAPFNVTGSEYIKEYATQETREATPFDLAVSADGEIIGIIWKDWRSEEKGEIYFSYSLDGGKNWSKNARVNNESTLPMQVTSLVINDDGSVYVLWTNLGSHESIPGGFKGEVNLYFSFGKIKN